MARVAAVSTRRALGRKSPNSFAAEIAIRRNFERRGFEGVGLDAAGEITDGIDNDVDFNMAGKELGRMG